MLGRTDGSIRSMEKERAELDTAKKTQRACSFYSDNCGECWQRGAARAFSSNRVLASTLANPAIHHLVNNLPLMVPVINGRRPVHGSKPFLWGTSVASMLPP